MSTPHIAAKCGAFAKTVLMSGDPLRAKFIADTFLQNCKEVTNVRGMLGYTGTYEGTPVSVMGSGMGMPSIGIYSYELFTQYDVDNIIRIGSAGSYSADAKVFDVVMATAAYSESSYAKTQNGYDKDMIYPSETLNENLRIAAQVLKIPLREGTIHSSDVFYRAEGTGTPYWQILRDTKGCLAVEMESFALFHNANVTGKNAACLLTISDSFISHEVTTVEEREKSFTNMMKIALQSILV
ncbi:MAG: purine-nucleoside phosphorylase [Ruthenibacterium sp.]